MSRRCRPAAAAGDRAGGSGAAAGVVSCWRQGGGCRLAARPAAQGRFADVLISSGATALKHEAAFPTVLEHPPDCSWGGASNRPNQTTDVCHRHHVCQSESQLLILFYPVADPTLPDSCGNVAGGFEMNSWGWGFHGVGSRRQSCRLSPNATSQTAWRGFSDCLVPQHAV